MYKSLIKNTVLSIAVILVCWGMAFITGIIFEVLDSLPMWVLILGFGAVVWTAAKTALKEEDN